MTEAETRSDPKISSRDDALPRLPMLAELIPLAREDFWCFVELMFPVLHPDDRLQFAPYLELIASVLQGVWKGKWRRVIINLPPRHMKSILCSVLYTAWRLGRDPADKIICISYSDDLAHALSTQTRTVIRSDLYRMIFPGVSLEKSAEDMLRTTKGGYRYATAVGSTITGFGARLVIVDDPLQPEDANSATAKQKFHSWFNSSVKTRFNQPDKGATIIVQHRVAPDDPSGMMKESADFVLSLPLVAEKSEGPYTYKGRIIFQRQPGQILNPSMYTPALVKELRRDLPGYVFDSQYQQRPTTGGTGMFSVEKWSRYDATQLPDFELLIHSWDIGATTGGNASVCTVWGLAKNEQDQDAVCLLNVVRLKLEIPELVATIKAMDKRDKPAMIVVDEHGVGLGVFQWLHRDGLTHVLRSTTTRDSLNRHGDVGPKPNESKIGRFGKAMLEIDAQRAFIPESAPWLETFLAEVAAFPNIPEDDQVDSMTQIVGNLSAIIRLARREKGREWR